jgi:oligopeptide/dipeptide ABC transporter ATP-binding protein
MTTTSIASTVSTGRTVRSDDLLNVYGLHKTYGNGVKAVNGVDLSIGRGEILGIVGESGCGKSSLVRLLMRLGKPDDGAIYFDGRDLLGMGDASLRRLRGRFQLVPQNPSTSLNPRLRVGDSVAFNLRANGWDRAATRERVRELFELIGLDESFIRRYPHELSGGQIQRIAIARALATNPDLIVCDEAVSALDKSVQAQILNLISDLQARLGLAVIFVSHDLEVVRHLSDRVAVMYLGRIVETGPAETVMADPSHPYTRALLASVPGTGVDAVPLEGEPPSPVDPPSGCPFRTRCPLALDACADYDNQPVDLGRGHLVRCLRVEPSGTVTAPNAATVPAPTVPAPTRRTA